MRVALAQVCSGVDPDENLALVAEQVAAAAAAGASVVVLPEATMASFDRRSAEVAEPVGGPWATQVGRLAARHQVAVLAGMFTLAADGRTRNTLLAAGPQGAAGYDKLHLYDAFGFRESDHVAPGDAPRTVTIDGVVLGLAVCYDIRFPDLFTHYARHGAHAVAVAASWAPGPRKAEQWRALAVARALDATSYVLACGQSPPESVGRTGRRGAPTGVGGSLVVSPYGEVLAEAGEAPELLVADLDPAVVAQAREAVPVLANARFTATFDG